MDTTEQVCDEMGEGRSTKTTPLPPTPCQIPRAVPSGPAAAGAGHQDSPAPLPPRSTLGTAGGCAPPAGGAPVLCRPGRHWGHQYRTLGNPYGQRGEGLWCAAGGRGRRGGYLAGSPRLFVCPVLVVADVPPLDLKGVGRGAAASEGARHLHILAGLGRHVVRGLGEQGCRGHSGGVGACGHGAAEWRGDGPTKLLAGLVPATQGWPQPSPSALPRAAQPHRTAQMSPGQPRAVQAPRVTPCPRPPPALERAQDPTRLQEVVNK